MKEKDQTMVQGSGRHVEKPEGVRRTTGGFSTCAAAFPPERSGAEVPDPEVSEKASRRKYTAEYKLRILNQADACTDRGQTNALLRREGLYSSNLNTWKRQLAEGTLKALSPKKRGPKPQKPDPARKRISELERENEKLRHKLKRAEMLIDFQKKISEILQIPMDPNGGESL